MAETLQRLRLTKLSREELICLRLYSGPMYYKYNALLRQLEGCGVATCKVGAGEDCILPLLVVTCCLMLQGAI